MMRMCTQEITAAPPAPTTPSAITFGERVFAASFQALAFVLVPIYAADVSLVYFHYPSQQLAILGI